MEGTRLGRLGFTPRMHVVSPFSVRGGGDDSAARAVAAMTGDIAPLPKRKATPETAEDMRERAKKGAESNRRGGMRGAAATTSARRSSLEVDWIVCITRLRDSGMMVKDIADRLHCSASLIGLWAKGNKPGPKLGARLRDLYRQTFGEDAPLCPQRRPLLDERTRTTIVTDKVTGQRWCARCDCYRSNVGVSYSLVQQRNGSKRALWHCAVCEKGEKKKQGAA